MRSLRRAHLLPTLRRKRDGREGAAVGTLRFAHPTTLQMFHSLYDAETSAQKSGVLATGMW
jgi:hypothetical protein